MANAARVQVRACLAVVACTALLGCSANDQATSGEGDDAASATTATPSPTDGSPAAGPDPTAPAPDPAAIAPDADVAGARAALDRYLDAIAANDYPTALATSRDALQSLTVVRSIVHTGNRERGGTTSSSYDERRFEVVAATAEEVVFAGHATLTSGVSGPSGPPVSTTDTFQDVRVRLAPDGWRAATATYNGAPLTSFPASSSTAAGAVQVTLRGAVAFGSSLAVVLELVADGEHAVDVSDDALRILDEEAPSTSSLIVGGQPGYLYLTYPRRDEQPTAWRATVAVDGTPHAITLAF